MGPLQAVFAIEEAVHQRAHRGVVEATVNASEYGRLARCTLTVLRAHPLSARALRQGASALEELGRLLPKEFGPILCPPP